MADNIVGGLFGIDPAQYDMQQRQQRQQEFARDFQTVQLSPLEQSKLAILQGTRAFGRGVGQLLGGGDPELQKVSAIKQLSSQFDLTSATGLREFARALQAQYPQEAMMAAKRADELETSGLGRKKLESETLLADARAEAALREKTLPTSGLGKLLFEKDALLKAGVPANDPRVVAYDRAIAAEGEGKGTKVTVNQQGQRNVLDVDKKDAENLTKIRDSAENIIPRLQEQAAALQKGIAAGTFSDARVVFSTALSSLGIKDKATLDMLKNTKTFNSNRIELAASVAKQLGVNPTDRDFKASLDRFASASDAPESSAAFIQDLLTIQQGRLTQANEGLNYYRKNDGSFSGYNRPLPTSPVVSADPFAGKSLAELKKMLEDAKKKNNKD
jgi:hypothetical protein